MLLLYNASILFRNELTDYERLPTEQDGLIACLSNHSGPVRGLDFNPFQVLCYELMDSRHVRDLISFDSYLFLLCRNIYWLPELRSRKYSFGI